MTYRQRRIKVDFYMDSMGGVKLTPASLAVCSAYNVHMVLQGLPGDMQSVSVYLQEARDEVLLNWLSPQQVRHLNRGYTVTVLMDPEEFGCMLGYDAEHVDIDRPVWRMRKDEIEAFQEAKMKGAVQ